MGACSFLDKARTVHCSRVGRQLGPSAGREMHVHHSEQPLRQGPSPVFSPRAQSCFLLCTVSPMHILCLMQGPTISIQLWRMQRRVAEKGLTDFCVDFPTTKPGVSDRQPFVELCGFNCLLSHDVPLSKAFCSHFLSSDKQITISPSAFHLKTISHWLLGLLLTHINECLF